MSNPDPPQLNTTPSEERWRRFARLPKPFQYSLRTLLIVLLLVSLALIWPATKWRQTLKENERREREAAIRAQWHQYGAFEVKVDGAGNVVWATGRQRTDDLLEHLVGQAKLRVLDLRWSDVSDAGLAHLRELTGLQEIEFQDSRHFTDAGLEHLKELPSLENLGLNHTEVTDAGLKHLAEIPNLKRLGLTYTKVTDAGLSHLQGLTRLHTLALPGSITDAGLAHLSGLSGLRVLYVPKTRVTEEGVDKLQKALPNCEIFH